MRLLTGISAFQAGGDDAKNSSIADESSSSNPYIAIHCQRDHATRAEPSQSFNIRL